MKLREKTRRSWQMLFLSRTSQTHSLVFGRKSFWTAGKRLKYSSRPLMTSRESSFALNSGQVGSLFHCLSIKDNFIIKGY